MGGDQQLSLKEMDTKTQVQILNDAICISHDVNTFGKGMHLSIFTPAMSK